MSTEPMFDEYPNNIAVVRPDKRRFPVGSAVLVGKDLGLMFPATPIGSVGQAYAAKLNALQSKMEEASKLGSLSEQMQAVAGEFDSFFKEGLSFNYTDETVVWIIENVVITLDIFMKLLSVAGGEIVDREIFRS